MEDLHKFWKHRWLTPKAKVFKSKIFGYGPFAIEDIKKGELIRVTGGLVVPKKYLADVENSRPFKDLSDLIYRCPKDPIDWFIKRGAREFNKGEFVVLDGFEVPLKVK